MTLTSATVTPRPSAVEPQIPTPADDGLFGPDSVTWRLSTAPAAAVAIPAAVLVQMLHPRVMWMIDQASTFWQYPARRAQLTQRYGLSISYGDTATAEHAGATLRLIHSKRKAVDPLTGEGYGADQPDLLLWVHCTIPWAILRALDRWGPQLTAAERDRYVAEQRTAARLVGMDPNQAPGSVAELDAYMASMQPKLALTPGCLRLLRLAFPRSAKPTPATMLQSVFSHAALSLLSPTQRRLYGIRWTRLDEILATALPGFLLKQAAAKVTAEEQILTLRTAAMAEPFGGRPRSRTRSAAEAAIDPPTAEAHPS